MTDDVMCAQIAEAYGHELSELPTSLEALAAVWLGLMAECACATRPLRVALDSLERLGNEGGACR